MVVAEKLKLSLNDGLAKRIPNPLKAITIAQIHDIMREIVLQLCEQ